jgi:hypothetical protein
MNTTTPASANPTPAAPKPKPSLLLRILGGIAIFVVFMVLLVTWGWVLFTNQARTALSQNPVIQQHIGEIRKMDFDWEQTANIPETDVFVFHLAGARHRGTVTATFVTVSADKEEITEGRLRLDDGTEYNLIPVNLEQTP